jgi:hypothetical protein
MDAVPGLTAAKVDHMISYQEELDFIAEKMDQFLA